MPPKALTHVSWHITNRERHGRKNCKSTLIPAMISNTPKPVLDAHFVDCKFCVEWRGKEHDNKPHICFRCKRKGCWSTNHPIEERLSALKKKPFRQFVTSITNDDEKGEKEEGIVDELEETTAHVIDFDLDNESSLSASPNAKINRPHTFQKQPYQLLSNSLQLDHLTQLLYSYLGKETIQF